MSDSGLVRHSRKKKYGYKGIEKGNKVKILVRNIINKLHGEKVAEWKVLWIRCCVCMCGWTTMKSDGMGVLYVFVCESFDRSISYINTNDDDEKTESVTWHTFMT